MQTHLDMIHHVLDSAVEVARSEEDLAICDMIDEATSLLAFAASGSDEAIAPMDSLASTLMETQGKMGEHARSAANILWDYCATAMGF